MSKNIFKISTLIFSFLFLNLISAKGKIKKNNESRNFNFSYIVKIPSIPQSSKAIEIFVPLPKNNKRQKISNLRISTNVGYKIEYDSEYKNKLLHIYLTKNIPDNLNLTVNFNVDRKLESRGNYSLDTNMVKRFLLPDSLVPIDGIVKKEANKTINKNNLLQIDKARLLFNHVVDTMVYDKKSTTGWGRGDVLYACDARSGNCTDFHSLFIGLSRAEKIPSRFVIGFPIPENKTKGKISGYHCWAEFYIKHKGWIPIDASEAFKNPDKKNFFFGSLDANRVSFTTGRDIPLKTSTGEIKKVNYLIYPYILINNKTFKKFSTNFYFKNIY